MEDLGLSHGYVIYPGRERYSLGRRVTALPAEPLLRRPDEFLSL